MRQSPTSPVAHRACIEAALIASRNDPDPWPRYEQAAELLADATHKNVHPREVVLAEIISTLSSEIIAHNVADVIKLITLLDTFCYVSERERVAPDT